MSFLTIICNFVVGHLFRPRINCSSSRPIGGMTMLSLLRAYLKQIRDTLKDVVMLLKEELKRPPPKASKKVRRHKMSGTHS